MITSHAARSEAPPWVPIVHVMEDHDGAYQVWKAQGVRDRILFHFDAHMDFAWIAASPFALLDEPSLADVFSRLRQTPYWTLSDRSEEQRTHLGNYVHQAIRAEIVREFVWIYPDHPDARAQHHAVQAILESLSRAAPTVVEVSRTMTSGVFEGRLYGRPFRALPYSMFPTFVPREDVLLDVDLDFLVVQSLHAPTYPFAEVRRPSFWLSPEEFCGTLHASGLRFRLATLAYSVEEGYTPLPLKFLGAELARRLAGTLSVEDEEVFAALRQCFSAAAAIERSQAAGRLEELVARRPAEPALSFNLAMHLLAAGDVRAATEQYRRAIDVDPSYRTKYNHGGPALQALGRLDEAQQSFAQMQQLDPHNRHYRIFNFQWWSAQRDWRRALALGTELLEEGVDEWDVRMGLANCLLKLRQFEAARSHLERCSVLTMGSTQREPARLLLTARAAEGLRRFGDALSAYQRLIQLGQRTPRLHLAVARLFLRRGNLYKTRKHLGKAVRLGCLSGIVRLSRALRSIGSQR